MEIGSGMLFPVSVVDGLVHQLGGWTLQAELALKRMLSRQPCPVGTACQTTGGTGELSQEFDSIIHTTPPFYVDKESEILLQQCYERAFQLAFEGLSEEKRVAVPLLGAGARGFPTDVAIDIAARAATAWLRQVRNAGGIGQTLAFGLLEEDHANDLAATITRELRT
jgi:O-acetyl-ADP-ribose deacetylase (regulator of RNase III)